MLSEQKVADMGRDNLWERSFTLQANKILKAIELKAQFPEALM